MAASPLLVPVPCSHLEPMPVPGLPCCSSLLPLLPLWAAWRQLWWWWQVTVAVRELQGSLGAGCWRL